MARPDVLLALDPWKRPAAWHANAGIHGDLRAAHQDITPVRVATPRPAQIEPNQIDRMLCTQNIYHAIWQRMIIREFEISF